MPTKEIAIKVHEAEKTRDKIAMFHYQILIHADELRGVDAKEFCKEINVPDSYAIEYRKMLKLAEFMKSQRVTIKSL